MEAVEAICEATLKEIEGEIKDMSITELLEARRELLIVDEILVAEIKRKR